LSLTSGVTSAHRDELVRDAQSVCEDLALFFGAAVIIGVGAEFVIPLFGYFPYPSAWPAACVAIGVVGETIFTFRSSKLGTALTARANDRLANAERENTALRGELQPLITQRELPLSEIPTLKEAIESNPIKQINVSATWDTLEVRRFCESLARVLQTALIAAGIPRLEGDLGPLVWQSPNGAWTAQYSPEGITLQHRIDDEPATAVADAIEAALLRNGMGVERRVNDRQREGSVFVHVGAVPR
jgi:hypothetical protein